MAAELQLTPFVMSVWLPSENKPLAVKFCVWPVAMDAVNGVRLIVCNSAVDTVAIADPVLEPIVAVIVGVAVSVTVPVCMTVRIAVLVVGDR